MSMPTTNSAEHNQAPIKTNTEFRYMGLRLPIDHTLMSEAILAALYGGYYEADEAHHLPYVLQEKDRVLELGSGLGLISALCAASPLVDQVATVEANPALIPYIRGMHHVNGLTAKIEVMNAVAYPSPSSKTLPFYRRADLWASSLSPEPWGYEQKIDVPTLDLNKLIEEFSPSFLIVDIEGGEMSLFDQINLGSVQKIMLEIHQSVIGRHGVKAVFDALSEKDFHYEQWHSSYNIVTFSHVDRL